MAAYPPARTVLAELAGQLGLNVLPDGRPANPLVVLELDQWRDAPPVLVRQAAGLVADALPVTVGVLRGGPAAGLEPLIAAATLTLTAGTAAGSRSYSTTPGGATRSAPGCAKRCSMRCSLVRPTRRSRRSS